MADQKIKNALCERMEKELAKMDFRSLSFGLVILTQSSLVPSHLDLANN
jgi:hypothetical protein